MTVSEFFLPHSSVPTPGPFFFSFWGPRCTHTHLDPSLQEPVWSPQWQDIPRPETLLQEVSVLLENAGEKAPVNPSALRAAGQPGLIG